MATPFDDLGRAIENLSSNPEYTILNFVQDVALSLGIIAVIGILGFVFIRYVSSHVRYVKKTGRLGLYNIAIWDEPFLKGHVNKNEDFVAPDMLRRLKEGIPEWKIGLQDLERYVKDGMLNFYDIKMINDLEAKLKGGIDAILVSPVPLDHPSIFYEDKEGIFSFIGSSGGFFKAFPRNVLCSDLSIHKVVDDWFGQKKDVYFLVPF